MHYGTFFFSKMNITAVLNNELQQCSDAVLQNMHKHM